MKRMLSVGIGIVLCLGCGLAVWLLLEKNGDAPEAAPTSVAEMETSPTQGATVAVTPAQENQEEPAPAASENAAVPSPLAETAAVPKVPAAITTKTVTGEQRAAFKTLKTELAKEQEKYFVMAHKAMNAGCFLPPADTALTHLIQEAFTAFPDFTQARSSLADVVDWRELPADFIDDDFDHGLMMQEKDNPIIYYREYIDGRADTADFMVMQHVWQETWDRGRDRARSEDEREYMYYPGWGYPYCCMKKDSGSADLLTLSGISIEKENIKNDFCWETTLCADIIPHDDILAILCVNGPDGSGDFVSQSLYFYDIRKNEPVYSWGPSEGIGGMMNWAYDSNSHQLTLTPNPDPDHSETTQPDTIIDINGLIEEVRSLIPKTTPE